jgi:hypothetical protein
VAKERLGRITKMGDKYLRKLLVVGMTALVRRGKIPKAIRGWQICLRESPQGQRTEQEHADTYGWFSRNQKSVGALYAAILGPGSPPIQPQIRPFADRQ